MQRDRTSKYSRSVRGFLPGRQRLRSCFANEHSQGARWLILSSGHGSCPSPPNAAGERPAKSDRSTGGLGFAPAASCRCGSRLHDEGARRNKDLLATLIAERGGIADKSQIGLAPRDATSLDLDASLQPVTGADGAWPIHLLVPG